MGVGTVRLTLEEKGVTVNRTLPRIIALTPRGMGGAAMAVAAARAGALGMLDLEGTNPEAALGALRDASTWGDAIGARVECGMALDGWLGEAPESVHAVCCVASEVVDWEAAIGRITRSGRVAMAEVT